MTLAPLAGKQALSTELATARLNIWEGSVRSGKTVASLMAWLRYTRRGPAGNLVMIGRTERTLKRNIIDPLVDWLGAERCKPKWGEGELLLAGRRIYLAGANNEAAQEKIRGLTLAGAYVDELSLYPESFWAMLLTRLSIDGASLFGTTNPDNPNHWLMRDVLKRAAVHLRHDGTVARSDGPDLLDLVRMSFRLRDNAALSEPYMRALELEFTGLWRLRFIEGLWVLAEGSIYDTFDPEGPAVVEELPAVVDIEQWVVAIDYGTTNPFVALLIGVGSDDRLYVVREWRWDSRVKRRQLTDGEYSKRLSDWLIACRAELELPIVVDRVYVDPSAASFIAQLWRDGWSGVHGADNRVADGIRTVATLFAGGRLVIVRPGDDGTIDELVSYVWDEKAAKRGEERPLKVDDHGPDALRYGVMGLRRWWRHWVALPAGVEDLDEAA